MDSDVEVPTRRFRRRRRRARGSRRGLYLLPHLITTAGLFFGFWAIIQAPTLPDLAAVGIILAMFCDALDGRVARFAKSTSRFGVEYDSIADTVSFAVAPSILAFSAANLQVLGRPGWIMAFLFTVCAALRLARFNVSPGRYPGRFEGLPSPAAAGVVATTQLCGSFLRENGVVWAIPESVLAGGLALLALLMVSPIPYRSFKEIDFRHSYATLVLVVVTIVLVGIQWVLSLFAIGLVYTIAGPVEWFWRWRAKRPLEMIAETDPPVPAEREPDRMAP